MLFSNVMVEIETTQTHMLCNYLLCHHFLEKSLHVSNQCFLLQKRYPFHVNASCTVLDLSPSASMLKTNRQNGKNSWVRICL